MGSWRHFVIVYSRGEEMKLMVKTCKAEMLEKFPSCKISRATKKSGQHDLTTIVVDFSGCSTYPHHGEVEPVMQPHFKSIRLIRANGATRKQTYRVT